MTSRKSHRFLYILSLLALNLVLVISPRFDRKDFVVHQYTNSGAGRENLGDSADYVLYVKFFRGDESLKDRLVPPYTGRPLVPWLASFLPFAPMTSINLVNVTALLIAIPFLYLTLIHFELSPRWAILGCLFFIDSFPTFYYGAIGYVDPFLIAILIIGLYCLYRERWVLLAFLLIVGPLAKEMSVTLWPAVLIYMILKRKSWAIVILFLTIGVASVLLRTLIVRALLLDSEQFFSGPALSNLLFNLHRTRSWLSAVLAFGLPGLAMILTAPHWIQFARTQPIVVLPLLSGFLLALAFSFYISISVTYLDGRIIWVTYPFSIPLAVVGIHKWHTVRLEAR